MGPGTLDGGGKVVGHPSHSCSEMLVTNWKGVSKGQTTTRRAMICTGTCHENFKIASASRQVGGERQRTPQRLLIGDIAERRSG